MMSFFFLLFLQIFDRVHDTVRDDTEVRLRENYIQIELHPRHRV